MMDINITSININLGQQSNPLTPNFGTDAGLALNRLQPQFTPAMADVGQFPGAGMAILPAASSNPGYFNPTLTMADMTVKLLSMLVLLMNNKGQLNQASGSQQAAGNTSSNNNTSGNTSPSIASTVDGQKIDKYLSSKGSKAGEAKFGELAQQYGKQYDVDPLLLLAIAGHETGFGTKGVGLNGLLGVGAYDSDPNNSTRNSKFSGVEQQLKVGAQTFANLRKKGGASSSDPIEVQTAAVNKAGWATDPNWHKGVNQMYKQVKQALA